MEYISSGDEVRLRIDWNKLAANIAFIRKHTKSEIFAVVKDNGYGMGLLPLIKALYELGIRHAAVASFDEAKQILEAGIPVRISMLTPLTCRERIRYLTKAGVTLMVGSIRQGEALGDALAGGRECAEVQIKLDTGLGRYGFREEEITRLGFLSGKMKVVGTYTHFADPYHNRQRTLRQYQCFLRLTDILRGNGISTGMLHACASGGFLQYPEMHLDAVRLGSAIIGAVPEGFQYGLTPIWKLEAPIVRVYEGKPGDRIGYGGGVKLGTSTRWGVLPIGYSNGLTQPAPRARWLRGMLSLVSSCASSPPPLMLDPMVRPIGRIGANHLLADLTNAKYKEGDWVEIKVNPLRLSGKITREYV